MEFRIHSLKSAPPEATQHWLTQARRIFFETAGNPSFASESDRARFQERYFDSYLITPDLFFLAIQDQKILGYLAGAKKTLDSHFDLNPYLSPFRQVIENTYPAHLHINLSATAQGGGIGSHLISTFESQLKSLCVTGVHIVTSISARNVSFYRKNHFNPIEQTEWNEKTLLLMGKQLA